MKKLLLLWISLCMLLPSPWLTASEPDFLSLTNLAIPESLGKVEDRFQGNTDFWIIQIQDVHAHFVAQENIAAIADHLNAVYGIRTFALEGGWGETRFEESWGLPSSREKQMLARGLLEEEYITGPAYAALFSQSPLQLIGIEQQELYEQNRVAYLEHTASRSAADPLLEKLKARLIDSKKETYGSDLFRFDQALQSFRDGKKADQFVPLLLAEAKTRNITLGDLNQVLLFEKALAMEQKLDKNKLKAEATRIMTRFKNKRLSFEELLRSKAVPEDTLQHFPASREYLDLMHTQDLISYQDFFAELETAISRVKESFFENPSEKTLDASWMRYQIARKILHLEATPGDVTAFAGDETAFRNEMNAAGLAQTFQSALLFYELARKRDDIFYRSLLEDTRLKNQNVALITGGFHTDAISRELRKAGISYLVITPSLGGESPNQELYLKRLQDTLVAGQTLAPIQNRFFSPQFDKGFVKGVLVLKDTRNIFKAVEVTISFVENASGQRAPLVNQIDWANLKTLSCQELTEWLQSRIREAREENQRMYLVIDVPALESLLKDRVASSIWESIREDRANTVILGYENLADIPMEAIGGRFEVRRVQKPTADEIIRDTDFQTRYQAALNDNVVAVILPKDRLSPDGRVLTLGIHPVSLLFRIFLTNPTLRSLAGNPEFLDNINALLLDIQNLEAFLKAA